MTQSMDGGDPATTTRSIKQGATRKRLQLRGRSQFLPARSRRTALGRLLRGDSFLYHLVLLRAVFAALLAIVEQPVSSSAYIRQYTRVVHPILHLVVQFFQLNLSNSYALPLPPMPAPRRHRFMQAFERLFYFEIGIRSTSISLVGVVFLAITLLIVQFRLQSPSRYVIRVLSTAVWIVTGILYMPMLRQMTQDAVLFLSARSLEGVLGGIIRVLCIIVFLPLCLFVSQNGFENDEQALHLFRRKHNRLNFLEIAVKALVIFTNGSAVVNLTLFSLLLVCHFLTFPFHAEAVNRVLTGVYASLAYGASCRLYSKLHGYGVNEPCPVDRVFWIGLPVVFILSASITLDAMLQKMRAVLNEYLTRHFTWFDLADKPEVIDSLHLANLLESPTRMGKYAHYKAEKGSLAQATTVFQKALMKDPEHASNLGNYAVLLLKKGDSKEAERYFRKALKAAPDHRENLERFAHFLNQRKDEEALFFYQQSLLCYLEHSEYRDMYANSSDPMFILAPSARIIDCNGASLYMFRAKSRADLVNHTCKVTELFSSDVIPADFEDSFSVGMESPTGDETSTLNTSTSIDDQPLISPRRSSSSLNETTFKDQFTDKFCETLDRSLCTRFPSRVITLEKEQLTVRIILTRIRKGSRYVLHLAIMDVTKLTEVVQTNKMILQTAMTCMIIVDESGLIRRVNLLAEETFGYPEKELRNRPIRKLIPAKVWAYQAQMASSSATHGSFTQDKEGRTSRHYPSQHSQTGPLVDDPTNGDSYPVGQNGKSFDDRDHQTINVLPRPSRMGEGTKKMYSVVSPQEDEAADSGTAWGDEVKIRSKDGRELTCSIKVNRLENSGSHFYVVCLHDVTELMEALEQNRLVFDSGTMAMVMLDDRGLLRRINKAACTLTGFSHPNEALGMNVKQFIEPDFAKHNDIFLRRFLSGRWKDHHLTRDVPVLVKTGEVRICSVTLSELHVNADRYFLGLLTDMTNLKRSLEINNLSFQRATVPMIMTESTGKIVQWNKQSEQKFQYSADHMIGRDIVLIMAEKETPRTPRKKPMTPMRRDSTTQGMTVTDHPFLSQFQLGKGLEVPIKTRAGQLRTCLVQMDEFKVSKSRFYILCLTDVTAINEALQTNQLIFAKSMVPTFVIDERARFLRVNDSLEALTGHTADELLGTNCKLLLEPSAAKHSDMFLRKFLSRAHDRLHEFTRDVPVMTRDEEIRVCTVKLSEVVTGSMRFFVGLLLDITEVQELIEKNAQVFDNAPTSMLMLDDRGCIVQLNKRVVEWLGYSEDALRGHNIDKLLAQTSVAASTQKVEERRRSVQVSPASALRPMPVNPEARGSGESKHSLRGGRGWSRSSSSTAASGCRFLAHYSLCTLGVAALGQSPKAMPKGSRARWEDKIQAKDGSVSTAVVKVNPIQVGSHTYYLVCLQDITKLKEAALSNTEAFENSPRPLLVVDAKGIIQVFNAGARSLSGHSGAGEVVGRHVSVFLLSDPATGATADQLIRTAASLGSSGGEEASTLEVRVVTRVGDVRMCNMRVLAQQQGKENERCKDNDKPGVPTAYVVSLNDVTALRARVDALRGLFDACNQPMLLVSDAGVVQDANTAVERQWGHARSTLCGHGLQRLFGGSAGSKADVLRRATDLVRHAVLLHHVMQGECPESGRGHLCNGDAAEEVLVATSDGRVRLCELRVTVVSNRGPPDGQTAVDLLLCTFHDVTVLPDILSPLRIELERCEEMFCEQNGVPYRATLSMDWLMTAMAGSPRDRSLTSPRLPISLLSPRDGSTSPSPRTAELPFSQFGWGPTTMRLAEMWNARATGTLRTTAPLGPSIEEEEEEDVEDVEEEEEEGNSAGEDSD